MNISAINKLLPSATQKLLHILNLPRVRSHVGKFAAYGTCNLPQVKSLPPVNFGAGLRASMNLRSSRPNSKLNQTILSLPFFGALFNLGSEESAPDVISRSAVEEILELPPIDRCKAANNLLIERTSNLGLNTLAAVSLISLAARSIRDFNDNMAIFSKDLTNSTMHDSESDEAVLKLLESDREVQLTLLKAQDATLRVRSAMQALKNAMGDLCCMDFPLSDEVTEKAQKSIDEAEIELREAEDFLSRSVVNSGPPDALLSRVVRMTEDLQGDLGFSLDGLSSAEVREMFNRVLALHLKTLSSCTEKEIAELKGRSKELRAVDGKEGEQKRLDALIKNKEEELRRTLEEQSQFQVAQMKKELEQQVQKEKRHQVEKTSHDNQTILQIRKFAFDRELEEHTDRINKEIESWKERLAQELAELGPNTKKREFNVQKFSDAFTFANTCFQLQSALTTDPLPQLDWKHQVQPIKHLLEQVANTTESHTDFVQSVIQTIPAKVVNRGVYTDNALKQRFKVVESTARRVSFLKEKENNSMAMYIMSYVRSFLLLRPAKSLPEPEKLNQPVDFAPLNNEDLLDRAKYFMELGDLRQAACYVNMLQGVAQHVTSGWIEEVVLHLETVQAAEALSCFAALLVDHYHNDVEKFKK